MTEIEGYDENGNKIAIGVELPDGELQGALKALMYKKDGANWVPYEGNGAAGASKWSRDIVNGYIYPKTTTDKVKLDELGEYTAGVGVTIESLNIKGTAISTPGGASLELDSAVTANGVVFNNDLMHCKYIDLPVTETLWVDANRLDSYTEDGSINKPFKTIQSAIASTSPGSALINVAPGEYSGDFDIGSNVTSIKGSGVNSTIFTGNIIAGDRTHSLEEFRVNSTGSLTCTDNIFVRNLDLQCPTVVSGTGFFVGHNVLMITDPGVVTLTASSTGELILNGSTIISQGDVNTINQNAGTIVLFHGFIKNTSFVAPTINSTGGILGVIDNSVYNTGFGAAIDMDNDGNALTANTLSGVVCSGNISCGTAKTIVEGLNFVGFGSLSGTDLVYRPASRLDNDSSVTGSTVKDALDNLDGESHAQGSDTTLGIDKLVLDTVSDPSRNSLCLYSPNTLKNIQFYCDQLWNVSAINTSNAILELWADNWKQISISNTVIDAQDNNIVTTGDVGIGITIPAEKLDVVGNVKVSGNLTDGANATSIAQIKDAVDKKHGVNDPNSSHYTKAEEDALLVNKSNKHISINTQTDNYTLVLSDDGKHIEMDKATAVILTVPKNSVIAFTIGTAISFRQKGAGKITITPIDGDVTIDSQDGLITTGQHAMASLLKVATDTWVVVGSLEA